MTAADTIAILDKLDNRGYITKEDFAGLKVFIAGQAAELAAANAESESLRREVAEIRRGEWKAE